MKQLSKAGLSVNRVGIFNVSRIGRVYELEVSSCLPEKNFNELYRFLVDSYSYFPVQILGKEFILLRLFPVKKSSSSFKKKILFTLTLFTIFLTGYGLSEAFLRFINDYSLPNTVLWSTVYTALFISALGLHELGHMRTSRESGVVVEGPYFIPAPPIQLGFIGTLGAVINMKTLPPDRESLAKLGLSGPLTGYIVGLLIGVVGVFLSPLISIEEVEKLVESGEVSEVGFSPLTIILLMMIRNIPEGYTIYMHPLLFLSFIVFLVTFLNLLPIGQLDGGHVVRAYTSLKTYEFIGLAVITALAAIGGSLLIRGLQVGGYYVFLSIVLFVLKLILGRAPHMGAANQCSEIKTHRYLFLYIVLLVLTMPIPIQL